MNSIVKKILGLSLTAALLGTGFAGCKDDTSEGTSADKAMVCQTGILPLML